MDLLSPAMPAPRANVVLQGFYEPARASQATDLRVHYQNDENQYEGLGVWFWGDVVTPSEKTGPWPGGRTVFPPENISPDGAFIDIALLEGAAQVGTLVIDGQGTKLTPEDLLIDLPGPQVREVWINNQLEVFYEDQRQIPDNHLRVRFLRASDDYTDMGVWFWGVCAALAAWTLVQKFGEPAKA